MIIENINEAKTAWIERPAKAFPVEPETYDIGKDTKDFVNTGYLTVDITNGKEPNLEELRQRFPRIKIFKLRHLVLFGNHISLYRLDLSGVKK